MAKPPLLLLPGMMNSARVWDRVLPLIAGEAQVLAAGGLVQDSMQAQADYAWEAARALPKPLFIAGFSMGGLAAMSMFASRPDDVAGIAFINTGSRPAGEKEREISAKSMAAAVRDFERFMGNIAKLGLHPAHESDTGYSEFQLPMMRETRLDGYLAQQRAVLERPDPGALLAGYTKPACIVCSPHDRITPKPLSDELAAMVPQASFHVIENAGHWTPLEAPEAVAAAVLTLIRAS